MVINPKIKTSFETVALPVAKSKNMGVIAMKAFAADGLAGQASPEKLLYYALSLPVSTVSVGMPALNLIEESGCHAALTVPADWTTARDVIDALRASCGNVLAIPAFAGARDE